MITLNDILNKGILDTQLGVKVYEFDDMSGHMLYSGKVGFIGGIKFMRFFRRYRDTRVRFIQKHSDEYKELLITLQV